MSTLGTNIGLKALLASQVKLETIGHNLANANTPGYSRQSLHVSSSAPISLRGLIQGTGIDADVVSRTVDALLHGRITNQVATIGRLDARLDTLTNVESFLGGTTDSGLPAMFKKMFQSLATLSTAPEDTLLRTSAVQSAVSVAGGLNQLAVNSDATSRTIHSRLRANVSETNRLAEQIGSLNRQIMGTELGTASANDLRDQRDQSLKELAKLVDLHAVEDDRGAVRVLVGGRLLVSPTTVEALDVVGDPSTGAVHVEIDGHEVDLRGGQIGGLLAAQQGFLPQFAADVDAFARNLILEANRVHSTGVPASGSFRALLSANALQDTDHDGAVDDELLRTAGLPFDVSSGELYVNVIDEASGAVSKHRVAIDTARTTTGQLVAALDSIPSLSAKIDSQGRVQIMADVGKRFDFSTRLDPNPDPIGSFGSGRASLATGASGPFALASGDTLDFVGPASSFSVAFNAASFVQVGAATADEIAALLNADANFQANGMLAHSVGGALVVQSSGSGATESFQVAGGTSLTALGWSAGTNVSGSDADVAPRISGLYSGSSNATWTFRPTMDGTIGTTPGLTVEVFDAAGRKLTEVDVGPGYVPGDEIEVMDGVKVAFGFGHLSASQGDRFQTDVVADSDTSDVLVALGLNSLFVGHDAQTIAVRADIESNPSALAGSTSGAQGDGSNVLRLLDVESLTLDALSNKSLDEHLSDIVSGVGLEIDTADSAREAEQFLLDGLEARRDQVSGVNTDEELVNMIEQEQAYSTAAQYLRVVNDLMNELMSIL